MNLRTEVPILSISVSSETPRVNAYELYVFLKIDIPFKLWIEDLLGDYEGFHSYIAIKEPAIGRRDRANMVYYINLRIAKIAALKAASTLGEIANEYFKGYEKEEKP
ncbi:MAG: hypothetical protein GY760_00940 [Deltaproteobacteria bacterium]|nr:hypothetical protein [Deltaproteobacteria bacterium]